MGYFEEAFELSKIGKHSDAEYDYFFLGLLVLFSPLGVFLWWFGYFCAWIRKK